MDTTEKLAILKELQEIDRRIDHFRKMEEYEPRRLGDKQAALAAQESRLGGLGDRHSQTQRDISRKELDIKARQEKINRLKGQMMNAGTNKEYQAFLKEVSLEEVEKGRVEDELLEMMISTESFAEEEKSIGKGIEEARKELEIVKGEVKVALEEAARQEAELAVQRSKVADKLDADTLRRYEGLFKSRSGEAVVKTSYQGGTGGQEGRYLCGGCFMPLTHQMVNLLLIGQEIITCKSCGRILYIDDHKED